MKVLASGFIVVVALLHLWFLMLEMFFWKMPLGLRTFKMSIEKAELTSVLAANQGLYNGFLALGLLISFVMPSPDVTFYFQIYFLVCVVVAGLYGAWTVSRNIFVIQALPAVIALLLISSG